MKRPTANVRLDTNVHPTGSMVAAYSPHQMADMFRDLIQHVEEAAEVSPDDPSLIELKRIVVLRIGARKGAECG